MIDLTPERYERTLQAIAAFPRRARWALLAKFIRRYRLDDQKTRTDFAHMVEEQRGQLGTQEETHVR